MEFYRVNLEMPKFRIEQTVQTVQRAKVLSDEEKAESDRLVRKAFRVWRLCRNKTKVLGK